MRVNEIVVEKERAARLYGRSQLEAAYCQYHHVMGRDGLSKKFLRVRSICLGSIVCRLDKLKPGTIKHLQALATRHTSHNQDAAKLAAKALRYNSARLFGDLLDALDAVEPGVRKELLENARKSLTPRRGRFAWPVLY